MTSLYSWLSDGWSLIDSKMDPFCWFLYSKPTHEESCQLKLAKEFHHEEEKKFHHEGEKKFHHEMTFFELAQDTKT